MLAKYILGALAVLFLAAGLRRLRTNPRHSQGKTWTLVGAIFAVVSAWLFLR